MKKLALVALLSVFGIQQAQAQGDVGLLVGYGSSTEEGAEGALMFGASGSYSLTPEFSLGASITRWAKTEEVDEDNSASANILFFGLDANYFFVPGLYAGATLGLARTGATVKIAGDEFSDSTSDFFVGANVGYDHALAENISVGAAFNFDIVMADESSNFWSVFGAVKYKF